MSTQLHPQQGLLALTCAVKRTLIPVRGILIITLLRIEFIPVGGFLCGQDGFFFFHGDVIIRLGAKDSFIIHYCIRGVSMVSAVSLLLRRRSVVMCVLLVFLSVTVVMLIHCEGVSASTDSGGSDIADGYDGYYEDADPAEDESATLDFSALASQHTPLRFKDTFIRKYTIPEVIPPVIDDDFINVTESMFACRPSIEKRKEREDAREAARRLRMQQDESATKKSKIQSKLNHRTQKKDRDEVFGTFGNEGLADVNTDGTGLFFFGLDSELTNFSSFNSSEELINASIAATNNKTKAVKLSYRQKHELKKKYQVDENVLRQAQFLKTDLGPTCEELTCASCKLFIDETVETIRAILSTVGTAEDETQYYQHVTDIFRYLDICASETFVTQNKPFASMVCSDYFLNVSVLRRQSSTPRILI
jgi:hypothetical protein